MTHRNTLDAQGRFQATRWLETKLQDDSLLGLSVERVRDEVSAGIGREVAVSFVRGFLNYHPRAEELKAARRPQTRATRSATRSKDAVEIASPLLDALEHLGQYDPKLVSQVQELRIAFSSSRLTTNLRRPDRRLVGDQVPETLLDC